MTEIDFLIIMGMIIIFLSEKRLVVISLEYGFNEEKYATDRD